MLSQSDIRIVEQVIWMESAERERFIARLSTGAQDLLDLLLEQYAERW